MSDTWSISDISGEIAGIGRKDVDMSDKVCVASTPGEKFVYDAPPTGHVDLTLDVKRALDAYARAKFELARVKMLADFSAIDAQQESSKIEEFQARIDATVGQLVAKSK